MSASAPLLEGTGKKSKEVALDEAVYAAEVKPHLVHEAVRAELNARRAGTFATKSRGLVSGGRAKPWRQKGTGRARQGTIRAPQFKAGGHTFAKVPRSFVQKVNRKAQRSALRSALAAHAQAGTLGIIAADAFTEPSTKQAMRVLDGWAQPLPLVVVCLDEEAGLDQVVPQPAAGGAGHPERARGCRSRLGALAADQRSRAGARHPEGRVMALHAGQVVLAPVVSEKSYAASTRGTYTFKVHPDAHKVQIRQAVEQLFEVKVVRVNVIKVQAKPKRRGAFKGTRPGWKKAVVQLRAGDVIEIFQGAQLYMPVRRFKPTSPGRRFMTVSDFAEVTKSKPEKALTETLTRKGGRNNQGRITTRHQGGGHKRRYRLVDFKRTKDGVPAKVAAIEYDPNRSALIALLHYADGFKAYILAPAGLRVGSVALQSGPTQTSSPGTRCRSRTSPPARSCTTSSSSRAAAARWRARQAPVSSWSPRTAATRRCVSRRARCAAC